MKPLKTERPQGAHDEVNLVYTVKKSKTKNNETKLTGFQLKLSFFSHLYEKNIF